MACKCCSATRDSIFCIKKISSLIVTDTMLPSEFSYNILLP